jgi:hypothetical protein
MNARKHRQFKQAKETVRLDQKVSSQDPILYRDSTRIPALPVYRANLNHPVNKVEHGKAASSVPIIRADLTARRVPERSIGMTEEANASGNALNKPTSVWSEMVRKQMEPRNTRKANDGQRQLADASERCCPKEQNALRPRASIAKLSDPGRTAGRPNISVTGHMMARAV